MKLAANDPYKVLQVDPDAEPEVIRAAYRALALKYHPDLPTGSEQRMAALNEAWLRLRDTDARARHDQTRGGVRPHPADHERAVSYPMPGPLPATPPGPPAGSVLEFGRYSGWSLGQIVVVDPDYLEWLARASIGKPFKREIQALWATRAADRVAAAGSRGSATR